ncbi:MAG: family 78 glycoside hydrolase catalytic domain [Oscillospiraceae bacterium]|nr:family 78 glycoside hydrolase catalytic domain [Candidatus Equicaccousia limihippi]
MKIENVRVNHLKNPVGFDISHPVFSFNISDTTADKLDYAQIKVYSDRDLKRCVYDSTPIKNPDILCLKPDKVFKNEKRYYFTVEAHRKDEHAISDVGFFEGGRSGRWDLPFIRIERQEQKSPFVFGEIKCEKKIKSARLYITGLGLFHAYINGQKIGDEVLTPYLNDYFNFIQYLTFDVTENLLQGKNQLSVLLGEGWCLGRYGYLGADAVFGKDYLLSFELKITYSDGTKQSVTSDDGFKYTYKTPIISSSIYDGENFDATVKLFDQNGAVAPDIKKSGKVAPIGEKPKAKVIKRLSLPVKEMEEITPQKLIISPTGEQIIDFGQEFTGYVEMDCPADQTETISFYHGEILQDGCYYRGNLRSAKVEYHYKPCGAGKIKPYFTFFGFRYVKIDGIKLTQDSLKQLNIKGKVIYSQMQITGKLETSDKKINRLIQNAIWSQKGNFVDVPTDCPQRDERLGWTGDAQAFCSTACYNMYTPAFYSKYLYDMLLEQKSGEGEVPYVVPDVLRPSACRLNTNWVGEKLSSSRWHRHNKGEYICAASCAWGDAATVIPYTNYLYYGDKYLLKAQYENMRRWTDFIIKNDRKYCGDSGLWNVGFHFADWLALDNEGGQDAIGGTDSYYVASVYYYYSCTLTAFAAKELGLTQDQKFYSSQAKKVKNAIINTYFDKDGYVTCSTQTAYVLAVYFDIYPAGKKQQTYDMLAQKLAENNYHLNTGFVGTTYLCHALTKAGHTDIAYKLLFNQDFPSWLYEVNLGATTIWERWNSVLPDGSMNPAGMNSLNHYTYGSVLGWMYQSVCGIAPDQNACGFKSAVIAPEFCDKLQFANAEYLSASGKYAAGWEKKDGKYIYTFTVPPLCSAKFIVPEGYKVNKSDFEIKNGTAKLKCGTYQVVLTK